jgi:hypothetical protein
MYYSAIRRDDPEPFIAMMPLTAQKENIYQAS